MAILEKANFLFWDLVSQAQDSGYLKIVGIFIGIFVVFSLLALARKYLFKISVRGTMMGFILGLILMIILDLAIIIGLSDKEALAQLKEGERKAEAAQEVLVSGFSNLGKVLGVSTVSSKKPKNAQEVLNQIFLLPQGEAEKVKDFICP